MQHKTALALLAGAGCAHAESGQVFLTCSGTSHVSESPSDEKTSPIHESRISIDYDTHTVFITGMGAIPFETWWGGQRITFKEKHRSAICARCQDRCLSVCRTDIGPGPEDSVDGWINRIDGTGFIISNHWHESEGNKLLGADDTIQRAELNCTRLEPKF